MRRDEKLIGAAEERRQILAKVRRMKKGSEIYDEDVLGLLEDWLLARAKRYEKSPGGLGRKKKA